MEAPDEITQWLARTGRKTLNLEGAKLLAAESPQQWYVASHGTRGFIIGKMTMQKYTARHILVDETGQAMHFPTVESAMYFMRTQLKIEHPHIFDF